MAFSISNAIGVNSTREGAVAVRHALNEPSGIKFESALIAVNMTEAAKAATIVRGTRTFNITSRVGLNVLIESIYTSLARRVSQFSADMFLFIMTSLRWDTILNDQLEWRPTTIMPEDLYHA